jgi:hypothetical protein
MAGPSIVVKVLGDTKGLAAAMKETSRSAQTASAQIHGAFTGMLSTLNRTGVLGPFGESIATVNESLDQMSEKGKGAGKAMIGLGGTLAGVGVGLAALGSADQAARQQLQAAVEATGQSWDDYDKRVEEAIRHQERFGDTANQTQDALRILTTATNSPAKALDLLSTATDLAAAKHEGLSEAATQLGKVYNGNTKLLKQFGITITSNASVTKAASTAAKQAQAADKALATAKQHLADVEAIDATKKKLTVTEAIRLRDAQQKVRDATANAVEAHKNLADAQTAAQAATANHVSAVDQLSQKLHGQAAAAADTFTGKLKAITATVEDQAAKFGQKYGPAITAAGVAVTALGSAMEVARTVTGKFATAQETATAAQAAATAAAEAETVALEATAGAEVAAETAGIGLMATVGLIVLAIAALGVAAYVIYRNWDTIWNAMKTAVQAVWNWIKTNWPLLISIILGPIGVAAALIIKNWDTIKNAGAAAVKWITDRWNDFIGFFTQLPGRIANIASTMWDSIWTNFKRVMDQISATHVKVGGIDIGAIVQGISGGILHPIPHLASGGLITQDGLIYAHAGEAITPAAAVRSGPAIVMSGDNHFHDGVDVDLFMRKATWAVQTQGI